MSSLSSLIDLPTHPLVSIVGAGGKTTTMYTLANELAQCGQRVITTTTTNIYIPKAGETETLIVSPEPDALLTMVNTAWKQYHRITVAKSVIGAGKLVGLQPEQPYELLTQGGADAVIVEADGARHLMIKAPAEYEPVVPPQTNVALLVMSASAINQPLTEKIAHRPERITAITGINQGELLTPTAIARLMTSDEGGMKHIPVSAKCYLLITHASMERQQELQELISYVQSASRFVRVCWSSESGVWFDTI